MPFFFMRSSSSGPSASLSATETSDCRNIRLYKGSLSCHPEERSDEGSATYRLRFYCRITGILRLLIKSSLPNSVITDVIAKTRCCVRSLLARLPQLLRMQILKPSFSYVKKQAAVGKKRFMTVEITYANQLMCNCIRKYQTTARLKLRMQMQIKETAYVISRKSAAGITYENAKHGICIRK